MSWFSRLRNALSPGRLDEDLADEIADHLARRAIGLNERGLSTDDAERQARLRFGNATRLKEESRDWRLWTALEDALQDARYACRGMSKNPAFAATTVLSLALAIGANTAVYSIVDAAILRPLPVRAPDRLFMLSWPDIADPGSPAGPERDSFSYPEFLQFIAATHDTARLALFSSPAVAEVHIANPNAPIEKVDQAFISGQAFDMLGIHPALGRLFSADEDRLPPGPGFAVLSYDYWHRRFGADPKVIGREVVLNGRTCQIVGVARQGFFGVEPGKFVDVWLPAVQYESRALTDAGWHWFQILGRFAPGISPREIQARLQPAFHIFRAQSVRQMPTMPPAIQKQFLASQIRVNSAPNGVSQFRKTFSRPLWIVFGVAAVILFIACANVASLLLARATARATEMAMRVSLGAARMRLVRQLLTEGLMLSLVAGILGWLLALVIAPALVHVLSRPDDPIQFALALNTRVLFFCVAISTLAALLFGLAPAWQASGQQPMNSLRASTGQAGKLRLGKFFVSIQVACAFCLVLVGAAFLFSLFRLFRVNPGFDARNVAVLNITTDNERTDDPVASSESGRAQEQRLRQAMLQIQRQVASQPGIHAAALAWWPIFNGGGWSEQVIIPGKGPSEQEEIFYPVSGGYFAALRTPFIAGRDFEAMDKSRQAPAPAIVNEAFARKYFNSLNNVVGREFSYVFTHSPVRVMVVGVVSDACYYDLRKAAAPIVYLPLGGNRSFTMYVRSPLQLGQIVRLVDREARSLPSRMRIREITTLEEIVGNTLLREKLLAAVGGVCAFFGLLLAGIGLFGLLNYSVGRRTKEIGIRAALGAQRNEIIQLVLRDIIGLLSGGLIAGLAGALAVVGIFRSLLFGIQSVDPFVVGTAIGLFLITGALAASLPAHRAATIDPVCALRQE